jgi:putative glutamine amidotransferase
MRDRPLIGISPDEVTSQKTNKENFGLPPAYSDAVHRAGGIAVLMTPPVTAGGRLDTALFREAYELFDGILLSGGLDLNPDRYGQEPLPTTDPGKALYDEVLEQVIEWRDQDGKPLLAICRGMQALNVARGGTLHQHLPDLDSNTKHLKAFDDPAAAMHRLQILPGSNYSRIMGVEEDEVNSFHHQAPDKIGRGLVVTARAPDGIVEVIESENSDSAVIGVQFHAELMPHCAPLFEDLVTQSALHSQMRRVVSLVPIEAPPEPPLEAAARV